MQYLRWRKTGDGKLDKGLKIYENKTQGTRMRPRILELISIRTMRVRRPRRLTVKPDSDSGKPLAPVTLGFFGGKESLDLDVDHMQLFNLFTSPARQVIV